MVRSISFLIVLNFLLIQLSWAQEKNEEEKAVRLRKAQEILQSARITAHEGKNETREESILIKKVVRNLVHSGTKLKGKTKIQKAIARTKVEKELFFAFPNRIRSITTAHLSQNNLSENFLKTDFVVKGDLVEMNREVVLGGRKMDVGKMAMEIGVPEATMKQIDFAKSAKENMETSEYVRQSVWMDIFPVLLDLPWEPKPKFIYFGKAQSGDTTANILEYLPTPKEEQRFQKEKTKSQIRLFFDEETNRLLMITSEVSNPRSEVKSKYFFSDYQKKAGLLFAKKINSETVFKIKHETVLLGQQVVATESKTISESIITKLKIGAKFNKDTFKFRQK